MFLIFVVLGDHKNFLQQKFADLQYLYHNFVYFLSVIVSTFCHLNITLLETIFPINYLQHWPYTRTRYKWNIHSFLCIYNCLQEKETESSYIAPLQSLSCFILTSGSCKYISMCRKICVEQFLLNRVCLKMVLTKKMGVKIYYIETKWIINYIKYSKAKHHTSLTPKTIVKNCTNSGASTSPPLLRIGYKGRGGGGGGANWPF